jgi:hypothetical protein
MAPPRIDTRLALFELEGSSRRFTELLRWVKDPSATAIGHWSIAETAIHLGHLSALFVKIAAGEGSPIKDHLKLDEYWAKTLTEDKERDLAEAGRRIEAAIREFVPLVEGKDPTETVAWHGNLPVPRGSLPCILINECELHGRDIALADGRKWPIEPVKAQLAIRGLGGVLPYFVNPGTAAGLDATFELRLRGDGRIFMRVRDGELEVYEDAPGRIDCHLSVDPVGYLLVGYGRRSRARAIATGQLAAWGRRPTLAMRFAKLFVSP